MIQHAMVETLTLSGREHPLLRLVVIGILTLVLLIPIEWIAALSAERAQRRSEAVAEVGAKWGERQRLVGPAIIVPYVHQWIDRSVDGQSVVRSVDCLLTILPRELAIQADVDVQERHRGIFAVPVYRAVVDISGVFAMPDLSALQIDPTLVDWRRVVLSISFSDPRAIQNRAALTWNGAELPFLPGSANFGENGIHAALSPIDAATQARFATQVVFNGSSGLYFTPSADDTTVSIVSAWPSPSFQGNWLPTESGTSDTQFRATWKIPSLGRNLESTWTSEAMGNMAQLERAEFGVDLHNPVDAHRMAERSVKYARLFVVMTFATIWLIGIVTGVRVHPIQYLLIGAALCSFYLLELSLAEQIGFATAYAIASAAVAGLIGIYSAVALRGWRRAALVTATVAALYVYLFIVLSKEDYALLFGSIGVFVAVATAMLMTRSIDWYGSASTPPASASTAGG